MTDIETIDKVRSEDLQGSPGGAESTGSAAFEADSPLPPTSRSDMTDFAPPMPGQSAPPMTARRAELPPTPGSCWSQVAPKPTLAVGMIEQVRTVAAMLRMP